MWPVLTLSNGFQLKLQERVAARALQDFIIPKMRYGVVTKEKPLTVRKGDRIEVQHNPPGYLTMVKPCRSSNRKFSYVKHLAVEGVDFELI